MRTASSYNKQINSLSEIKEIITHIYDHIEPGVDDDCGWCGDILLHKKRYAMDMYGLSPLF